jgi:hypothetical protein
MLGLDVEHLLSDTEDEEDDSDHPANPVRRDLVALTSWVAGSTPLSQSRASWRR